VANDVSPAPKTGGRIEGGVDAVVVGANLDGLSAAALLGKAGLKTILLGAGGAAVDDERREFEPGFFCIDGEHLAVHLDPELVAGLDLYRHGLEFANRRLETVYYFADGGALLMDGDPYNSRAAVAALSEADAERYAAFIETALDAGRTLRGFFDGGPAPAPGGPLAATLERFLSAALDDVLDAAFEEEHLKTFLAAEALLRSGARPGEPYSFAALIRRFAGEAAGLQGAVAYPEGGAHGVKIAVRRAAQAAKVDFRPATGVTRVLVEWDRIAGLETSDGGQIRTPIVVNALPARRAFLDLIGPELLDIEFQAGLEGPKPRFASARIHFALTGEARDERTRANLSRRLVYAPTRDELARAFGAARRGEVGGPLIMEAVFPSAYDPTLAPEKSCVVSAIAHPVPWREGADESFREAIAASARNTFERIAPGSASRIIATDVRLASDIADEAGAPSMMLAAAPAVVAAWARARRLTQGSGVDGYFFCGPEAQIGPGLSGAPGRRAAEAAVRYFRRKVDA
jgi:phytoene dehydrogenase-like protein